ncbi:MAG: single-stranded-DNA-specific exonuclease RecJ [Chloroflexota bacterium]|nr:single-stranded-DNA-specific exonuclease RecJ [Chloroflexota bacterium]
MVLGRTVWQLAPPAPAALFERFSTLDPLVVQLLYNRGLTTHEVVDTFLAGTAVAGSPLDLVGMGTAVSLIRQQLAAGENIVVYGDYDVDGITATAVLMQTLESLGGHVRPYIPDREDEGYGLNCDAIRDFADAGVGLLITVDCGIRSLEEVALARRLGMAVVITDHHHLGEALPSANAVLNPRRPDSDYPFKDLAGVGVAFKLAEALLQVNERVTLPTTQRKLASAELLDLVALGTVADMVPLLGENHFLVQQGLLALNAPRRPGVNALMEVLHIEPGSVDATTISFGLAPRLNAAGRIDDPLKSLQLLLAPDMESALPLARDLQQINQRRRKSTAEVQERVRALFLEDADELPLLFAVAEDFPAGIVGLAAGRLSDEFYRPAVVVRRGLEFSKGSARSIPEFHITEALDKTADLLVRHGGHAAAAGFTVRTTNLPALRARLTALAAEALRDISLNPSLRVDVEVPLSMLSWKTLDVLAQLAPFGYGNPQPTFVSRGVRVQNARAVGSEGRHLKLYLIDREGQSWDAIAFRQGDWIGRLPSLIDLVYYLERNEWKGRVSLQLNVRDIHPAGAD